MQSLRSSGRHLAARPNTIQVSSARARGRTAALIGVMVLLTGVNQLYAQSRTATPSLVLQVRPEELLQDQNGSVVLKIRLDLGTTARLWAANSCTSSSPQSHVITMSGIYSIPLSELASVNSNPSPSAMRVCLVSSDGALYDSRPVEILGTGNGAAVQGPTPLVAPSGVPVDVPAGWVATTRGGTTTWSNP